LATKKTSKKKTVKKTVKKGLKKVSPDVSFYMIDGSCCSDLLQLSEAIDRLADDMFQHHVKEMNNDFANWVEAIFDEKGLAKKLRNAKTKNRHVVEILKFVVKKVK